ncbi:MAG: DNRLRE domain-containing protein [Chloroflexi bacterium]|nr:DNRLRE domain-containing protein [Chloroflexota bacterium]
MQPRIHESWGRADRPSILIALAFVSAAVFGLFLALSTDSTRPATADTASFGATADSQVQEDKPTNNYGTRANMDVKSQPTKLRRDFVAFDVSSIPAGSTVNSATLTLCLTRVTAGRVHEVRQVTQSWAETTVTVNTQPTVAASVTDSITMPAAVGCVSWTVTSDVQAWVDGAANNGWRVGDQDETTTGGNEKYRTREDTTVPAEQPRLDVDFVISKALPQPTPWGEIRRRLQGFVGDNAAQLLTSPPPRGSTTDSPGES